MKPKQMYWALSSDATDDYARELFEKRYGKQPLRIKRYPRSVLLLGPIEETPCKDSDDGN